MAGSRSVAGGRSKMQEMQEQVQNAKLGRSNIPPCCSQMTFHFLGWMAGQLGNLLACESPCCGGQSQTHFPATGFQA